MPASRYRSFVMQGIPHPTFATAAYEDLRLFYQ